MDRRRAVACVALFAVAAVLPAGSAAAPAIVGQEQVDADRVVLGVTLQPDGDARWQVEHRVRLATDNETAAFGEVQADVRANASAYTVPFRDRMSRTAATASNATGRSMAIENVTVTAEQRPLPQTYGVLTYRFRWTNFAAVDSETVRAGDALAGLFLDEETTLRLSWPAGYEASRISPEGDETSDSTVAWHGPREFGPDQPAIVVAPSRTTTTTAGDPGTAGTAPWLGGVALVGLLAIVGYAAVRRRRVRSGTVDSVGDADGGNDESGGNAPPDGGSGGDSGSGAPVSTGGDEPPPALLSNEERVLRLLEANGGRLKQQTVAERLDWTTAKTSQVIGDMRDADAVETFRLGRENVVTFPDEGLGDDLGPDGGST